MIVVKKRNKLIDQVLLYVPADVTKLLLITMDRIVHIHFCH
jgi:hypothetical protein